MSKEIDQKVVEMRFDNRHFEQNVSTTMSSIRKLEDSCKFKGATKGFDNLDKSAKKVDMTHLGRGLEMVQAKFSAMQVIGTTALVNITNSAMAAGKKIVSALTIDPVKTGFQEYETQMNAVQTILANTASKGSTLKDVNAALDELNTYADKTIYNFTEMTRNIGTFTAAGIDLDTSVNAIQGIANLAAVSGSTSQQASTAMYQLSQALAAGTVKLMDWNSVVNAGMGGEMFQNALKETSKELGTGAEAAIKASGSFRESLKDGWLTAEVLTSTLKKFTTSGANEYVAKYTGLSAEAVEAALKEAEARYGEADAIEKASEALAKKSGKNKDEIKSALQFAKNAEDAATKVKTFSQLWDVMKESAQSGWAQTWKLIVGDFEQAKNLLTPLADFFTGMIGKMSDARNKLLKGALGKTFTGLAKKIQGIMEPIKSTTDAVKNITDTVKDYGKVVDQIIGGKWGNGASRWKALADAGYDWAHAQNLVNEKLGDSTRHATKYKEAQKGVNDEQGKAADMQVELTKSEAKRIEQLANMSDAELKRLGYTDKQIKAFRELKKEADKLGIPIKDFILQIDELDGRTILINSFKNIGQGLVKTFRAMADAWKEIFPPMTSNQLYNIIAGFHKLSTNFKMSDETADQLKRTFKGLFAALDIVLTVVGTPIKLAFKILCQLLSAANVDILWLTAYIGDAIVKFRDWIDSILDCTKIFEKIIPTIKKVIQAVKEGFIAMKDWAIANGIIDGIINGLQSGISKIGSVIVKIATFIIDAFKNILGIHSPSVVFMALGGFLIAGLIGGIMGESGNLWEVIKSVCSGCLDIVKNLFTKAIEFIQGLDFGTVIAGVLAGGIILAVKKVLDIVGMFGNMCESAGNVMDAFAERISPKKNGFERAADAIKTIATSILMLAGSIYILAKVDGTALQNAIKAIGALTVIMGLLVLATSKIQVKDGNFAKVGTVLLGLSAILYIMATAMKKLSFLNEDNIGPVLIGVVALVGGLIAIMAAFGKLTKGTLAKNIDKASIVIRKIATTMLMLAIVMKLVSKLDDSELERGIGCLLLFGTAVVALLAATKLAGPNIDGAGQTIKKIAGAMILMTLCIKLISWLDDSEISRGIGCILMFSGIITGLIAATKLAGNKIDGIGKTILGISAAMALMALTVILVSGISQEGMGKGLACITMFGLIIVALVKAVSLVQKDVKGVAGTMIAISLAIAVLAGVSVLMGLISLEGLAKGVTAVSVLSYMMTLLVKSLKDINATKDLTSTLTKLMITLGLLVAAVVIFTFIDPAKLAVATVALTGIMGMFTLLIRSLKTIESGKNAVKGTQKTLLTLVGVVAALAIVLGLLSNLSNPQALIPSAAAIGILLLTMSTSLAMMDNGKRAMSDAKLSKITSALIRLTGVIAALALIIGVMSALTDPSKVIPTTIALGSLLLELTAITAILSMIKMPGKGLTKEITALTAMVIPLATFGVAIWALSKLPGMSDVTGMVKPLGVTTAVMLAMTPLVVALSKVGAAMKAAGGFTSLVYGIGGLEVVLVTLITTLGVLGGLVTLFPSMTKFVNKGADLLCAVASGIGRVIGSFVSGIAEGVLSFLPKLGTQLSDFWTNGEGFFNGIKNVNSDTVKSAKSLASAILAISAAGVLNGIMELLSFGTYSMDDFGESLGGLGKGIATFGEEVKNVKSENVKKAADAVKELAKVAKLIPGSGGIIQAFTGEKSITKFGISLVPLGQGLFNFSEAVTGIKPETVKAAASAAKELAKMTQHIPNQGGMMSWFAGDNSVAKFGSELGFLGIGLANFSEAVKYVTPKTIKAAASAANELAKMTQHIPNQGGMVSWFAGDNSIAKFGNELILLGSGLAGFDEAVSGITPDNIKSAASAAKELAKMTETIPNSLGIETWIGGKDSMAIFAGNLKPLGEGLSSFATSVEDIDNPKACESAIKMCQGLAKISEITPKMDVLELWFGAENPLVTLTNNIPALAKGLVTFSQNLKGIKAENLDNANKAATALQKVADSAKKLKGIKVEDLPDFAIIGKVGGAMQVFNEKLGNINSHDCTNAANAFATLVDAFGVAVDKFLALLNKSKTGFVDEEFNDLINKIDDIGKAMKNFANEINAGDNVDIAKVTGYAKAAKTVCEAMADVAGKDFSNLEDFGNKLGLFGGYLASFYGAVGESITEEKIGIISKVKKQLKNFQSEIVPETLDGVTKSIKKLYEAIGKLGGVDSETGESSIETNATKFEEACKNITAAIMAEDGIMSITQEVLDKAVSIGDFITALSTAIESSDVTAIAKAIDTIVESMKTAATVKPEDVDGLIAALKSLATQIASNADVTSAFTTAGKKMIGSLATGLTDSGAVEKAKTKARATGKNIGNAVTNSDEVVATAWKNAGKQCIKWFAEGIANEGQLEAAKKKGRAMAKAAGNAVGKSDAVVYPAWKSAGKYCVEGFAAGISENHSISNQAAKDMAEAALKKAKEELDQNSPSRKFMDVGSGVVEGFAKGIDDNYKYVDTSAVDLAARVLETTQSALKINSPSLVFDKDVGRWVVEGFAEGIDKNNSAEEKMKQKATNIKEAFQKSWDSSAGRISNLESDFNLWQSMNPDASEGAILDKERDLIAKKIVEAKQNWEMAEDYHVFMKEQFEKGNVTQDALNEAYDVYVGKLIEYNNLQNEHNDKTEELRNLMSDQFVSTNELIEMDTETRQVEYDYWLATNENVSDTALLMAERTKLLGDMSDRQKTINNYKAQLLHMEENGLGTELDRQALRNQIKQLMTEQVNDNKTLAGYDKQLMSDQSKKLLEYNQFMNTIAKEFEQMGMTREQIEEAAIKYTGYDPNVKLSAVNVSVSESTEPTEPTNAFANAGETSVSAFASAIQNGDNEALNSAVTTMVTTCADKIKENRPSWVESGKFLVEGFVEGIRDEIAAAARAAAEMAAAAYAAAQKEIDSHSPSRKFAELGRFVDMGFAQGISKYARVATDATSELGESAINSMWDTISNISDLANSDMDITPRIRPVFDTSSLRGSIGQINGIFSQRTMELATINAGMVRTDMDNLSSMVSRLEALNDSGNNNIVKAIGNLRGDFGSLVKAIDGMHIRMDSGTVVGELINKIDGQLGQIANHKGRGN